MGGVRVKNAPIQSTEKKEKEKHEIFKSIPVKSSPEVTTKVQEKLKRFLFGNKRWMSLKLNKQNAKALKEYITSNFSGVDANIRKEGELYVLRLMKVENELATAGEKVTLLEKPEYLKDTRGWKNRYWGTEYVVFLALEKEFAKNPTFQKWFNSLPDAHKRAFLLYVRSEAISQYVGNKATFNNEWDGNPAFLSKIVEKFIKNNLKNAKDFALLLANNYREVAFRVKVASEAFMNKNAWLKEYLGENFSDFKLGLIYFFMEHNVSAEEAAKKGAEFFLQKENIEAISNKLIKISEKNLKISPASNVSDEQIKEIVASALFAQLFYSIDSGFLLSIISKESNFDMKRGGHGIGVTQQTQSGGGVRDLQSSYWRDKVSKATGLKMERQLASMHLLNHNIFVNVMEGAKTIAVKCAQLGISTAQIDKNAWKVAYKYNGNMTRAKNGKTIAENYADWVSSTYKKEVFSA